MNIKKSELSVDQLERIVWLRNLNKDEKTRFLEYVDLVSYKQNENVFLAGTEADSLLLIIEGRMRVMSVKPNQASYFLRHVEEGQSLGEVALIDGGKRSANVEAIKDCLALRLDQVSFDKLRKDEPKITTELLLHIFIQVCNEFRDLTKRLATDAALRETFK